MKIIVPMAGRGSRLRPHTLTVPKPLVPVAGVPIVNRLVSDIVKVLKQPVDEIAFVLGDKAFFGQETVNNLTELAKSLGAKASIYRQDAPLGTGHAIMCAKESLQGPCVIAYADTLIRAEFDLDPTADATIWVKKVKDPSAYGVVALNDKDEITALVEKPKNFVSDLAVIGIYYFKETELLKDALQHVIDNNIIHGGEYQINDGIKKMMENGKRFTTAQVSQWMDCGNKNITVETNTRMLKFLQDEKETLVDHSASLENSKIIPPCFIGKNVKLKNATVGPYVSIGANTTVEDSVISESIIQQNSQISNAELQHAMIGNHVHYNGKFTSISIGDYSILE